MESVDGTRMTWSVLTGRPLEPAATNVLDDFADVTVATAYDTGDALLADIDRFDAIIFNGLTLSREHVRRATRLKVIASVGVGVDAVDVPAATEQGIIVCNNPGANTRAVAEYTITSMLAVRRRLVQANRDMRAGIWEKYGYVGPEVEGQVMGVLGYGAIGRLVSELARRIGMRSVAYDPYVDDEAFADGVDPVDSVQALFETADAVGVHVPLTDETRGLVGEAELRALGPDGVVVNAARGGIVDESALVDALRTDAIWGAAVDVFEDEPVPTDHPLFECENVIVSPHLAGSTRESVPAKDRGAAENVRAVFDQRLPESTVNRDALCMWTAYDGTPPDDAPESDPF